MKSIPLFCLGLLLSVNLTAQNLKFTVYTQANTPVFTTNSFKQVAIGKHNNIWVGTANAGIYKFDGSSWLKSTVLTNVNVKTICRTPDSAIIVGHIGYNGVQATTGGVDRFADATFSNTHWGTGNGLPSRYVNSVCVSNNGTVWTGNGQSLTGGITDEGGIAYLNSGATNFVKINSGLPSGDKRVYAVATSNTEVWAAIDKACPSSPCVPAGILRYSTAGAYIGKWDATNTPIPYNTLPIIIRAMCFNGPNQVWVGMNTSGLAVYNAGTWQLVGSTNSKFPAGAAVNFNAIKADGNGRIYIGTTAGLLIYKGGSVTDTASYQLIKTSNGLPSNNVTGIETPTLKTTWLPTDAGIVKMEEMFLPDPNGWSFANSRANIWPPSWWSQFDYTSDPYLGGGAAFFKRDSSGTAVTIASKFFPDWPLFVDVIGEGACYQTVGGVKIIRNLAMNKYATIIGKWGGSCFGFVQSSFMAWDSLSRFKSTFSAVGPWTSTKLFDLPLNDFNRKCINHLMTKQSQQTYWTYINGIWTNTPRSTLTALRQMLNANTRNERGLLIYNQNGDGGHIVNPYKIVRDTVDPDVRFIYIYDNNYPGDTTRRIAVDSLLNCWYYNLSGNASDPSEEWGGITANKGLILCTPVRDWYNPVALGNVAKSHYQVFLPAIGNIEMYNLELSDILITNASGKTEGYAGGKILQNIPDAVPMINLNASKEPPRGYTLPDAEYDVKLSNFATSASSFKLFNNTTSFSYSRAGATINQKDLIHTFSDGMLVNNQDNILKFISLNCIFENSGNEMNVDIKNLGQSQNGNTSLTIYSPTQVKLYNSGSASSYNLSLRYVSSSGESKFAHANVPIAVNTSHIISPDWVNLKTALVLVYVDNGNNGSYEDTLYLGNEAQSQFLSYPTKLVKPSVPSIDTIHLINNGAGILNWTAASSDTSWLKILGANTGTDTGYIVASILQDTTAARNGSISFTAVGASNSPYIIKVSQKGLLSAPENLRASDGNYSNGVHLKWNSSSGATHYKVYRSTNAGSNSVAVSPWIHDTTYIDTSCVKGEFYYYRIKAAQDSLGLNETDFSSSDDGWAAGFNANFSYIGTCSGQPTSFTETSNVHNNAVFSWDINNDGTTDYLGREIHHTFSLPGTYEVKLSITDANSITETIIKTVVILAFPQLTIFSDTTICANQSITLNAGSGFTSYLWSTGATTPSITVDSTGFGLGLTAINVLVTGNNGCSVTATTRVVWDSCGSTGGFTLTGVVSYDNTASTPLSNTTVLLKQGGNTVQQTTTDSQGNYSFTNLPGGTYVLTGSTSKAWGGVNSVDALKVIRHFVGLTLLTGVRMLAADVNSTNTINSIDALLIAKRFVGIDTSFVAGNWAFAKDSVQFMATTNQTANLKAVAYGDVDGSYSPPAKMDYGMMLENKGVIAAGNSDEVEIPVSITNSMEIGAIALVLNIPSQFSDIVNVKTTQEGNLVYHMLDRQLRIAWYSLVPMKLVAGDPILYIKVHLKTGTVTFANNWTIDPQCLLADIQGDIIDNAVVTIPLLISDPRHCYLGQNIPNPFSGTTTIYWYMPEPGKVSLRVFDQVGNEVIIPLQADFEAGSHTFSLDASDLQSGTYNYRIEINGKETHFIQTKQFVFIN